MRPIEGQDTRRDQRSRRSRGKHKRWLFSSSTSLSVPSGCRGLFAWRMRRKGFSRSRSASCDESVKKRVGVGSNLSALLRLHFFPPLVLDLFQQTHRRHVKPRILGDIQRAPQIFQLDSASMSVLLDRRSEVQGRRRCWEVHWRWITHETERENTRTLMRRERTVLVRGKEERRGKRPQWPARTAHLFCTALPERQPKDLRPC